MCRTTFVVHMTHCQTFHQKSFSPVQNGGEGCGGRIGDAHMHLKTTSLKLLPWQPEVKKSLFQFLLLDNTLKMETSIR